MSQTILIVDDNPANLKLVAFILAHHGYQVATAVDASSALEAVERERPDLILMDIQLPGKSGFDLTKEIKAKPESRRTVVIALTAYAMKGDAEAALAAGCDDYLTKPIDTRGLPRIIEKHLSQRRGGD